MAKTKLHYNKTYSLIPAIVLSLAGIHATVAQNLDLSDTGQLLDGIAAIVNDGVVLKSELALQAALIQQRLMAENTQLPPPDVLAGQVLERLVIMRLQLQRADRLGVEITDEGLNMALADVARRNNVSLTQLPELLAEDGVDYTGYRSEMREQLVIEQLRQRDVMSRIVVTPRELEDYLDRQEGKAHLNQDFRLSHILVSVSATATLEEVDEGLAQALEIYERLQAGGDFAELAVSYSDGQSALEGGTIGWRSGDQLPTLFADIVPGMQAGQFSEPVRSASGYHLIKLDEVRGGEIIIEDQTHLRHILIVPNEILDDESARQRLIMIREQIIEGDDFEAIATVVSEDPGSAANGGDLGWNGPDSFVPEFQAVVKSLEIGELSEPFRSPFGWHIAEVLGRRQHDTTEDVQRQQALMALRMSKLEEETELWVRRLRDEAFVEYML
ncbi:MAG: peptidylprolyl isomerase [Gammaproteobacteria bacterium]|nr:peptidylprolyl isomerase [Gammaproteobacteria bacterium]